MVRPSKLANFRCISFSAEWFCPMWLCWGYKLGVDESVCTSHLGSSLGYVLFCNVWRRLPFLPIWYYCCYCYPCLALSPLPLPLFFFGLIFGFVCCRWGRVSRLRCQLRLCPMSLCPCLCPLMACAAWAFGSHVCPLSFLQSWIHGPVSFMTPIDDMCPYLSVHFHGCLSSSEVSNCTEP